VRGGTHLPEAYFKPVPSPFLNPPSGQVREHKKVGTVEEER